MAADGSQRGVLLDAIPSGVWVMARDGRILDANPAACELVGLPRAEVVGRSMLELSHPDDLDAHRELLAADPGKVVVARWRLWQRNGGFALVEGRVRVLADGRLVTVTHDVTELARTQRALAESEREFRGVFELALSGKATADPATGRLLRVNRRLCEMIGRTEADLVGRTLAEITHPEDREAGREALARGVRGETPGWTLEKRLVRPDGTLVWAIVTGTVLRDDLGRPTRAVATIHDITDRKRMEAALRESDRRKDEFLAVLSHELRNPLAPMRTALAVLSAAPPAEAAARARGALERQLHHLARLVDDLLDLTRVSRGKVQLRREPVDVAEVAVHTAEDHRDLLEHAGLSLSVRTAGRAVVHGDPTRLAQVVANLLQNAAKFTPAGGRVEVRVERERDEVVLVVSDDGVGMDAAAQARLFEPFAQADATLDRSRGGLGLGLALVRSLVELHGGTVSGASAGPGRGATFVVRLPASAAAPALGPAGAPRPATPSGGRRVLVVDDNVDAADTLRDLLVLCGHDAAVAHHGREALELARTFSPEVVLCDIGLPGMDGYAVARALRSDLALRPVLLVALTGYALPEDLRRAAEAGFDAHLAKPPPLDVIEALLAGGVPVHSS